METKYFCEICGTKPDQLSHHKSHLQTQKHKDNCKVFETDMKIFSILFRQVDHRKWNETEYADYIISKYMEKNKVKEINNEDITKWITSEVLCYYGKEGYFELNCFNNKEPHICYEMETGIKIRPTGGFHVNIEYKNWAINKILKYKETIIKNKLNKSCLKEDKPYKNMLSKYTNINFNKIKKIRNGLINLKYLLKPIFRIDNNIYDMELYNDDAVRYSCLLFHKFGIHSVYPLYNNIASPVDIEEYPIEKKDNSFYFYKEINVEHTSKSLNVINYEEVRIETKKVWVSCCMIDFINYLHDNESITYSYIHNDDFKYFIKIL